jgi:hypothetical protein
MIGGDQHGAARRAHCFHNPAQARIDVLAGFDGFVEFARVTNHVGIGKVYDEHIYLAPLDSAQKFVRNLER